MFVTHALDSLKGQLFLFTKHTAPIVFAIILLAAFGSAQTSEKVNDWTVGGTVREYVPDGPVIPYAEVVIFYQSYLIDISSNRLDVETKTDTLTADGNGHWESKIGCYVDVSGFNFNSNIVGLAALAGSTNGFSSIGGATNSCNSSPTSFQNGIVIQTGGYAGLDVENSGIVCIKGRLILCVGSLDRIFPVRSAG